MLRLPTFQHTHTHTHHPLQISFKGEPSPSPTPLYSNVIAQLFQPVLMMLMSLRVAVLYTMLWSGLVQCYSSYEVCAMHSLVWQWTSQSDHRSWKHRQSPLLHCGKTCPWSWYCPLVWSQILPVVITSQHWIFDLWTLVNWPFQHTCMYVRLFVRMHHWLVDMPNFPVWKSIIGVFTPVHGVMI